MDNVFLLIGDKTKIIKVQINNVINPGACEFIEIVIAIGVIKAIEKINSLS